MCFLLLRIRVRGTQPVNSSLLTQDHLFKWTLSSAEELGREKDRQSERKGLLMKAVQSNCCFSQFMWSWQDKKDGGLNSNEAYHHVYMFYISTFSVAPEYIRFSSMTGWSCAASDAALMGWGGSGLGAGVALSEWGMIPPSAASQTAHPEWATPFPPRPLSPWRVLACRQTVYTPVGDPLILARLPPSLMADFRWGSLRGVFPARAWRQIQKQRQTHTHTHWALQAV